MHSVSQTAELTLQLFHFQTNTSLQFPANLSVICIGKPNEQKSPDIDISGLPDSDVASRIHAQSWINGDEYHITDLGSSNGTYINGAKSQPQVFFHCIQEIEFPLGKEKNLGCSSTLHLPQQILQLKNQPTQAIIKLGTSK